MSWLIPKKIYEIKTPIFIAVCLARINHGIGIEVERWFLCYFTTVEDPIEIAVKRALFNLKKVRYAVLVAIRIAFVVNSIAVEVDGSTLFDFYRIWNPAPSSS